jgi:hypothetical protein
VAPEAIFVEKLTMNFIHATSEIQVVMFQIMAEGLWEI